MSSTPYLLVFPLLHRLQLDSFKDPTQLFLHGPTEQTKSKLMCTDVAAVTHSVGSHARIAGLGGLAGGSWSWGSLVLGISALAGGGLGSLRHGEGLQESL